MTATQVKRRRGTQAQCDAMTPVEGEIIVDTTNDRIRIGDGSLAGGHKVPNATDIQKGMFNTVSASGTDTITVTLDPVPASYFTNMTVILKAANTNTGAATLNVNGLGAKNIYKVSSGALGALAAGDLVAGAYYTVRYDGTQFVLEGSAGGVSSVTGSGGVVVSPTSGTPNVTLDTNNAGGVGYSGMFWWSAPSSTNIANGATTSGANIEYVKWRSGVDTFERDTGNSPSGTWRNINGNTLDSATNVGMFIRTA